jgi:heptaprenyl diphosphate synthase
MHRLEKFRQRRRRIYETLFSARSLCAAGLLMMPALLFNPHTPFRVTQFLFFWFMAWLSGKKTRPLITVLIALSITAFNLAAPYGRVLCAIGVFNITSGALTVGVQRAATLEGLIMLSRFSIRQDLRIPGGFGALMGESFRILALIVDRKHRISRKNVIADIDRLMIELSGDEAAPAENPALPATAARTRPAGFILLASAVILSWLPWFFLP